MRLAEVFNDRLSEINEYVRSNSILDDLIDLSSRAVMSGLS